MSKKQMGEPAEKSRIQAIAEQIARDLWACHDGRLVACLADLTLDVAEHALAPMMVRAVLCELWRLDGGDRQSVKH